MAYNWKDFLSFAENLYAAPDMPGPREAALRSAVSRAYYAAFRAALEFGIRDGFSPSKTGEDHRKIREHFRNSTPKQSSKSDISIQLERLHDLRRKADYENNLHQKPENMAYIAIGMARKVFQAIEELSK
ncbi:MAG: hypothetical protein ANABAC_1278 [Anaerolineae bacterium]|nr:MAG: hypothetical protein ANABAC_1278 [Anaerolineae bacterium]